VAKRAKPAASSRTLPNGRNKTGRFVKLEHYLLNSPAYRSLCCYARSLLVELYALYNGSNNGTLYMSVRQAQQRLGDVGRKAAEKAFNELQDRGFITVVQKGSFTCKVQLATTWRLTEHDCEGRPATKDFMRWTPPAAAGKNTVLLRGTVAPPDWSKCPVTVLLRDTASTRVGRSTAFLRSTQLIYHLGAAGTPWAGRRLRQQASLPRLSEPRAIDPTMSSSSTWSSCSVVSQRLAALSILRCSAAPSARPGSRAT